ncbi:MAG: phosphotransferase family protein [Hyphomonas sp.]|nr:phosphotransferase family protein [Hyphomonas sp.]
MTEQSVDLKRVIDASVGANKPKFSDIDPSRIAALISGQPDVEGAVTVSDISGGGASAGASSGIVVFRAKHSGTEARFVLRYAPLSNDHRIFYEYDVTGQFELQRRLHAAGLPVSNGRWIDPDGGTLGLPGYIMDHVEGVVADGSAFTGGLIAEADAPRRARLIDRIYGAMDRIHSVDWQALGLHSCTRNGGGETPVARYLNWFWKTAEWVNPPDLARLDTIRRRLIADAPTHHPDDLSLVHGDPGLGNYMFRNDEVVCILDWELSGILHPDMDVAMQCSLNDFFRAAAPPDIAEKIPSQQDWIAGYERVTGRRLKQFDYYRKLVALPSLIVSLSMNRNMPPDMQAGHRQMLEPLWAAAEAN